MTANPRPWSPIVAWLAVAAALAVLAAAFVRTRTDGGAPRTALPSLGPTDPTASVFEGSSVTTADLTARAAVDHQALLDAGFAYPGPGTPWPTRPPASPTPTATPTPDVRAWLPKGAIVDGVDAGPALDWITATYHDAGGPGAAILGDGGRRLLWDSRTDLALPALPTVVDVNPTRNMRAGQRIAIQGADRVVLVVPSAGADGAFERDVLAIEPRDFGTGIQALRLHRLNRGAPDRPQRALAIVRYAGDPELRDEVVVYGDGDVPPVVVRLAAPVEIRDVDGDGADEVVQTDGKGGRAVRRAADGYAAAVPFPPRMPLAAPLPEVVTRGAPLPPLPHELCYEREAAIRCWPATGGAEETVWSPGADGWRLIGDYFVIGDASGPSRGWRFTDAGRLLVMAQASGGGEVESGEVGGDEARSRLVVLDRASGVETIIERTGAWRRESWPGTAEWGVDDAGTRLVYVEREGPSDAQRASAGGGALMAVDLARDGKRRVAGPPRRLAACRMNLETNFEPQSCIGVSVAPDGATVALLDGAGLWLIDAETGAPGGGIAHVDDREHPMAVRTYKPAAWSTDGRWMHVSVQQYEGGSHGVLDVATGRLLEVPSSSDWVDSRSSLAFTAPDVVVHARSDEDGSAGFLALLRLDAAARAPDTAADGSAIVQADESWIAPAIGLTGAGFAALDPVTVDGAVRFGLRRTMGDPPGEDLVVEMPIGEHPTEPATLLALPPGRAVDDRSALTPGEIRWSPGADALVWWRLEQEGVGSYLGVLDGTPRLLDVRAVLAGIDGVQWSGR